MVFHTHGLDSRASLLFCLFLRLLVIAVYTGLTYCPKHLLSLSFRLAYISTPNSTSLVQLSSLTILTDPVFSPQPIASALAPTRLRPPPCSLSTLISLQIIDVVLISHNHYDHLDEDVVNRLANLVMWVVPKGTKGWFVERGVLEDKIREMEWWQECTLEFGRLMSVHEGKTGVGKERRRGLKIACTPAQHWSGRTPLDTNLSLWCGFVVEGLPLSRDYENTENGEEKSSGATSTSPGDESGRRAGKRGKTFFHAGDTGYSKGRLFSPFSTVTQSCAIQTRIRIF